MFASSSFARERGARRAMAAALGMTLAALAGAHATQPSQPAHTTAVLPPRTSTSSSSTSSPGARRQKFPYVILGAGAAAQVAMETLRAGDANKEILMICPHTVLPRMENAMEEVDAHNATVLELRLQAIYNEWRKQLANNMPNWTEETTGGANRVSILRTTDVEIDLERRVITAVGLSSSAQDVEIEYEQCLLATAGRPRELYVLDSDKLNWAASDSINILYTLLDFQNLAKTVSESREEAEKKHITVVGGGYLGTETVCALAESKQCRITHVLGERAPLAQYLPRYLSDAIGQRLAALGVDIREETLVTGLVSNASVNASAGAERIALDLVGKSQTQLETDYLVLASTNVTADLMGLDRDRKQQQQNHSQHVGTGLEICMGGILVNSSLEAYRNFFVAGNAATYFDPTLGRRRVDTIDHAVASGMWAAHNMLNTGETGLGRYTHQPTFRSNLAGLGLSFVGIGRIDAKLETLGVWYRHKTSGGEEEQCSASEEYSRGIVYYLENGKVVGVLLCNAKEMLQRARDVLAAQTVVTNPARDLSNAILLAPPHWLHVIASKPNKN